MRSRMRVLYLIDSMGFGGAESALRNLVQHLKQNEPDLQIELATLYKLGYFGEQLLKARIPVRSINASSNTICVLSRVSLTSFEMLVMT